MQYSLNCQDSESTVTGRVTLDKGLDMTIDKPLMSPNQVAELLNCKPSTIYSWAKRGKIPSFKIGGILRFDADEINEWIKGSRGGQVDGSSIRTKVINNSEIEGLIKGAIATVKGSGYNTLIKGKPDQSGPGRR